MFSPLKVGAIVAKNRFFMAPLTRMRGDPDRLPSALMAQHYAQRASAGLLIVEATDVTPGQSPFWKEPGIYNGAQAMAWRDVTDAVHQQGGHLFLQLCHGGRGCHPMNDPQGLQPVAPSAIPLSRNVRKEFAFENKKLDKVCPRALEDAEIPGIVAMFAECAKNAMEAGFDGIEIHGANGYLLDSFLRSSGNQRSPPYGGSMENRARLMFETVKACCDAIGSDRVGLRLSPLNSYQDMKDEDPIKLTEYMCTNLSKYSLAYLHLMRGDMFGIQKGDILSVARKFYKGNLVSNMGYTPQEAAKEVEEGKVDAVAFGTLFMSNPDLPLRVKAGAPLNELKQEFVYKGGPQGYTDYPMMGKAAHL